MRGLLLNSSGDLELDQFKNLKMIEGAEEIKQQIRNILLTNRGEWFLNLNFGTPWMQLFRNEITKEELEQELITIIEDIEGVDTVEVSFELDRETRKIDIGLKVYLENGETFDLTEEVG